MTAPLALAVLATCLAVSSAAASPASPACAAPGALDPSDSERALCLILAQTDPLIQRSFIAPKDSAAFYCQRAEEVLLAAIETHPKDARLLTRLALVNGCLAEQAGASRKVTRVRAMDQYCRRAIAADASDAMAHMLLGVLNYRLCRLSWFERTLAEAFIGDLPPASLEDAELYLRRAIALQGRSPCYHYALGRTLEALDREAEAIDTLKMALTLEPANELDIRYQEKAAAQLEKLAKRDAERFYPWDDSDDF
jgi:tetratricopeptide (TPR) repeat protein